MGFGEQVQQASPFQENCRQGSWFGVDSMARQTVGRLPGMDGSLVALE
jgi:hypothetical protein